MADPVFSLTRVKSALGGDAYKWLNGFFLKAKFDANDNVTGLINPRTGLDMGKPVTSTIDASGKSTLNIDYLAANVIPRQGTTATLTTLTAPKGELAVGLNASGAPEALVAFGDTFAGNKIFGAVPLGSYNTSDKAFIANRFLSQANATCYVGFDINVVNSFSGRVLNFTGQSSSNATGRAGDIYFTAGTNYESNRHGFLYFTNSSVLPVITIGSSTDGNETPLLSFFETATPTAQIGASVAGGAMVANTGTPVLAGSTFTGGIGTSAYTIGQIVRALKSYGLLAE